jgi:chemotaxis methyl-accepting protein methylase
MSTNQSTKRFLTRGYRSAAIRLWTVLPDRVRRLSLVQLYGAHVHALVGRSCPRRQNHSTYFFRNRPELEVMRRLIDRLSVGSELKIAVLGCSKGAEVYSIAYAIRVARPDLKVRVTAVDISQEILDFARAGVYSMAPPRVSESAIAADTDEDLAAATSRDQFNTSIFDRTTEAEVAAMFDRVGDRAEVQAWLKEGISWICANVSDSMLLDVIGSQDLVVANRFLCHMPASDAAACLRGIARLVAPGGHLFVSGVDLDVRTNIAKEMGWTPIDELIRDVYEGDATLINGWPLAYWTYEPFRLKRRDSALRYASVFRVCASAWFAIYVMDLRLRF